MSDYEFYEDGSSGEEGYLSSGSSDDELNAIGEEATRNENYLDTTVPQYSDTEFRIHFRVSRHVALDIAGRYETCPQYNQHTGQHGHSTAYHQVLIFLWYLGHQTSSFRDVGDHFNVTVSSVHRIIKRVAMFISNLSPQVITWPTDIEKQEIEADIRNRGFPNIIGVIDGTHIKIDRPSEDPDSYINRKGYYSIQVQVVCDHRRRISDIFLGYPGSVHDARVFRTSPLSASLREKCGNFCLLGDSAYPLKPNLLTPYKDRGQLTRRQRHYNAKHAANRYLIEHCFVILKQKFRQLYHLKLRSVELIIHLTRAACVLHNIAIDDEFIENPLQAGNEQNVVEEFVEEGNDHEDPYAVRVRDFVANTLNL